MTETTLDLSTIFQLDAFDATAYAALKELAFASKESLNRFLELVSTLEREAEEGTADLAKASLKLGMCYVVLGHNQKAVEWLCKAPDSADKGLYLGEAYRELKRYEEAITQFEAAPQAGADRLECDCRRAECHLLAGDYDRAKEIIDANAEAGRESVRWHHVQGRLLYANGEVDEAVEALERAVSIAPEDPYATFHLAYILHLHGSDERAKELYVEASRLPAVHVNSLINLSVIYEDECAFEKAADCLRRILAVNPNHRRAGLYLKDVLASDEMYIDEQQEIDAEKRNAVLDIPVSDFELSVRSRNCLKKMNIHTLGDLLRTTEAELLSYKNFGETSLKEIKAMLEQKGLTLGQYGGDQASPLAAAAATGPNADPNVDPDVAARPVAVLELSVRSRKCLQMLNITTVGELIQRSENELLGSRNFGQTSLEEIKNCLSQLGVSLKSD